ncbi:coiled-coil domain-containing protein [Shewanella xiamenensis]|uniref:hypothetical protein n=1 Tax=Shewanella xiamenensis TaxID=332186 RepID=UPI0021C23910|nr:hypothetical protein [Shewanella xiamenensis]MCT8876663.1 hypothetical protein [Shewanella xiamenensis]
MSNIATLSVSLVANTARFSQALVAANTSAKKNTNEIGKSLAGIGSAAGGIMTQGLQIGLGAVTALGAAVVANTMHTAKNIKEQENLSRQIGVNVNQFRALTSQLATFGVTADDVWSSIKDLSVNISDLALNGSGAFKDLTDMLKINVKEWNMAEPIKQLEMLMAVTKDMSENNRRQVADALGSDALLKVMDGFLASGKNVADFMKDYKAMGSFVTDKDLAMMEKASATWTKLGLQIDVVKERFGIAFAPIVDTVMEKASQYLADMQTQEGGLRKWTLDISQTVSDTIFSVARFIADTFETFQSAVIGLHNTLAMIPGNGVEPIKVDPSVKQLKSELDTKNDELKDAKLALSTAKSKRDDAKRFGDHGPAFLQQNTLERTTDEYNARKEIVNSIQLEVDSLANQLKTAIALKPASSLDKMQISVNKSITDARNIKDTPLSTDPNAPNKPTKTDPPKSDGMTGAGRKDALTDYNSMISSALNAREVIENNYKESLKKLEEYRLANTLSEEEVTKGQVILQADYDKQILDNKVSNLERFGLAKEANDLKFKMNLEEINKLEAEGEYTREQAAEAKLKLGETVFNQEQSYAQERIDLLNKMGLSEKANVEQRKLALEDINNQLELNKITEEEAEGMRAVIADNEKERLADRLDSLGLEAEALQLRQEIELDALAKGYEEKLITEQEYLDARAEMENEHFEQQREVWTESLSGFQEDMWGAWESISDGVGESFANMIVNGDDFGKSMQNVFKQMAVQYIAEKVKMFLIDKMYAAIAGKTNAKAAAAKGTEKVAEASLNALTSFAAAPWPINIGAPAFAAMIGGLAGGMAGGMTAAAASGAGAVAGQFHDGGEVPRTGTYILEGGEIVVPKNEARAITNLKSLKSNDTQSKPNTNLTIQISAFDSKSVIDQMDLIQGYFQEMIQKNS